MIIQYSSCMFNREQMLTRLIRAIDQSVHITNYGIAIAYKDGILKRVTEGL